MWNYIASVIADETATAFKIKNKTRILGGDINQTWLIDDGIKQYFVKTNSINKPTLFQEEQKGLHELTVPNGTKIPKVIAYGSFAEHIYLVMQYIEMSETNGNYVLLAQQLCNIHKKTQPQFGFSSDNYIGATPQINTQHKSWPHFYAQHRLKYQLDLAKKNGHFEVLTVGYQLVETVDQYFSNYQPKASLLHGDLWAGNIGFNKQGQPVIYDPACYYGDREADIAMTELFGRLDNQFYDAYNSAWPLDEGYKIRKHLYNLYHILNHLNLFGGGYETQAYITAKKLLCEIY